MSSQKTEHLGLHAWEPSDSFLRNEFNHNFSALDAAVGALEGGKCRMASGSYTGDGSTSGQRVSLGFAPQVVMVLTSSGLTFEPGMVTRVGGIFVRGMSTSLMSFTGTGFSVYYDKDLGNYSTNASGRSYFYVALA